MVGETLTSDWVMMILMMVTTVLTLTHLALITGNTGADEALVTGVSHAGDDLYNNIWSAVIPPLTPVNLLHCGCFPFDSAVSSKDMFYINMSVTYRLGWRKGICLQSFEIRGCLFHFKQNVSTMLRFWMYIIILVIKFSFEKKIPTYFNVVIYISYL